MLVLTRSYSESLLIGDNIKITVLGAKGNNVRIGIEAPKEITVHREEVYKRIHIAEDEAALTEHKCRSHSKEVVA